MSAAATARQIAYLRRVKAGRIKLMVEVDEAALETALVDAGFLTAIEPSRADLESATTQLLAVLTRQGGD